MAGLERLVLEFFFEDEINFAHYTSSAIFFQHSVKYSIDRPEKDAANSISSRVSHPVDCTGHVVSVDEIL